MNDLGHRRDSNKDTFVTEQSSASPNGMVLQVCFVLFFIRIIIIGKFVEMLDIPTGIMCGVRVW